MLKTYEIDQIRQLKKSGLSVNEVGKIVYKSPATIYKYFKLLEDETYVEKTTTPRQAPISDKLLPFLTVVDEKLKTTFNTVKIHREISLQGYKGSYGLLNKYVRTKRDESISKNIRISQRVETEPGEQAQVDWGHFGKIIINEKEVNLYAFIYVLSYSRVMYAEFVTSQRQQIFQNCHINAFQKLGVPKKIRYDNVKTVVISRDRMADGSEHIAYNFDFTNFAKYYKFKPELCPRYYPQSKGKVEAGVKYVRHNFMNGEKAGKTFKSLEEINKKLERWLEHTANARLHGTTKEKPLERWEKEKPSLFLIEGYPRYQNSFMQSRHSSLNSMVTYKKSSYWVPEQYALKKIDIVEDNEIGRTKLIFYFKGEKIIEHFMVDKPGGWVLPTDYGVKKEDKQIMIDKKLEDNPLFHTEVEIRADDYYDKFLNY